MRVPPLPGRRARAEIVARSPADASGLPIRFRRSDGDGPPGDAEVEAAMSDAAQPEALLIHATAVAIDGRAALLRGPSGSGKSDLALRLIDAGGRLVADDQSRLWRDGDAVLVRAPGPIAGLIEVRGVGVVKVESLPVARLALIADLVAPQHVDRLPEPSSETIFGILIPVVAIAPFEASAPIKLRLALAAATGEGTTIR